MTKKMLWNTILPLCFGVAMTVIGILVTLAHIDTLLNREKYDKDNAYYKIENNSVRPSSISIINTWFQHQDGSITFWDADGKPELYVKSSGTINDEAVNGILDELRYIGIVVKKKDVTIKERKQYSERIAILTTKLDRLIND